MQLLALGVEARFGAGGLRGLQRAVHGPAVVGQQVHHAGEAGVVLFAPVVVLVHGAALGEHVGLLRVGRRVGVAGEQLVLRRADVPVQVLAGIRDPVVQQLRVGTVAHDLHQLVHHFLRFGLLDAQLLVDLAAERAELAGAVAHVHALLDADDLRTGIGGLAQRAHAGQAEAHHAHVDVDGLRHRGVVDGLGRVHPRRGEFRRIAVRGRGRGFTTRRRVLGRVVLRGRSASGQPGARHYGSGGAQAQKRPAGDLHVFHVRPLP